MYRLALTMLVNERGKYLGIIAALSFTAFMMAQQPAIFFGILSRTTAVITELPVTDLWVMDPNVENIDDPKPLPDTPLYQVKGVSGVAWAAPFHRGSIKARLPDGNFVACQLIGVDDVTMIGGPARMSAGPDAVMDLAPAQGRPRAHVGGTPVTTRRLSAAVAAFLLLGGCTVGPDHVAPDVSMPSAWKEAEGTRRGIATDGEWWRSFRDPILEQLVREAGVDNLDAAQAFDRLMQARADLGATQAGLFPSFDGSGSFTQSKGMGTVQSGAGGTTTSGVGTGSGATLSTGGGGLALTQFQNIGATASWEIDLWGKTRRSIEATAAELGAAEADVAATRLAVLAEVAGTYVDLRTTQARIACAEDAVTGYRDTLALTRARKAGGLVAETEVVKAEASVAGAEAQVPPLRADAARARRRLAVLTGRNPGDLDALLAARKPLPDFHGRVSAGFLAELLRRRPDLVKAERKLAAATARIGVAQAEQLPTVKISGALGGQEFRSGTLTMGGFGTWSIGPTVTVPIFDVGKRRFQIESKAAQSDEAADGYRAKVLSALEEAENAFAARKADCWKRDALSQSAARYADALRLSRELFVKGLTGYLHVLDAERSLYGARDGLASAQGQCVKDVVTIFKTLGGGW